MTSFKAALEIDHRSFVFIAAARACTSWRCSQIIRRILVDHARSRAVTPSAAAIPYLSSRRS
jgi:hypothetical protein